MKKYLFIILSFSFLTLNISCRKFLDVNQNVNDPIDVPISTLLTSSQKGIGAVLATGGNQYGGLSQVLAVNMHQMTTREEEDKYETDGTNFWIRNAWVGAYGGNIQQTPDEKLVPSVLNNLDVIIQKGTDNDYLLYRGIAKILKAYLFSQFVDVFGDIPYSEFNRFEDGIRQPAFDDDEAIYNNLLGLLDEGISDVSSTSSTNNRTPSSDDIIYGGSKTKWEKAANSIKLKLYTQMRRVRNVSSEVTTLLSNSAKLIAATSESFVVPYGIQGTSSDDRNPGFADYIATQRGNHVSPWLYEIMQGLNSNIFNGIQDPRIPYYIYNQKTSSGSSESPTEYRDGGFISIYFSSVGNNRDHNQQNSVSLFGVYPIGGRYDDGSGGTASGNNATGAAPYRLITFADINYLKAELANAGVITGSDSTFLRKAMEESFRQIDWVVGMNQSSQTIPTIYGTTDQTTYITTVLTGFNSLSSSRRLEYIMTQKWLSSIGSHAVSYTHLTLPTNREV